MYKTVVLSRRADQRAEQCPVQEQFAERRQNNKRKFVRVPVRQPNATCKAAQRARRIASHIQDLHHGEQQERDKQAEERRVDKPRGTFLASVDGAQEITPQNAPLAQENHKAVQHWHALTQRGIEGFASKTTTTTTTTTTRECPSRRGSSGKLGEEATSGYQF